MKALVIVYLSLVILAFAACQKSNQDAVVPGITTDCLNNPNLCNAGMYHQTPGFTPYNYGGGGYYNSNYAYNPFTSSDQLCNCPIGTMPTYNNYSGLGCVQSMMVSGYAYATFGYASNNNQWTNIPQISNTVGYQNQGCFSGVVQSCLVGETASCNAGYTCRMKSASSRLGVCVSNNTNLGYGGQVLR